jgi:hypothetical protein
LGSDSFPPFEIVAPPVDVEQTLRGKKRGRPNADAYRGLGSEVVSSGKARDKQMEIVNVRAEVFFPLFVSFLRPIVCCRPL